MGTQPEIGHTAVEYLPRIEGGVMISEIKSPSMSHINESSAVTLKDDYYHLFTCILYLLSLDHMLLKFFKILRNSQQ